MSTFSPPSDSILVPPVGDRLRNIAYASGLVPGQVGEPRKGLRAAPRVRRCRGTPQHASAYAMKNSGQAEEIEGQVEVVVWDEFNFHVATIVSRIFPLGRYVQGN